MASGDYRGGLGNFPSFAWNVPGPNAVFFLFISPVFFTAPSKRLSVQIGFKFLAAENKHDFGNGSGIIAVAFSPFFSTAAAVHNNNSNIFTRRAEDERRRHGGERIGAGKERSGKKNTKRDKIVNTRVCIYERPVERG